jgi:hypothetical protein
MMFSLYRFQEPISYLCPDHLTTSSEHVTGIKYNYAGSTIVASYNDDDAYTMDTVAHSKFSMSSSSSVSDDSSAESANQGYLHRFTGHRNNDTVKQISFFGSRSEWVVSGSDCGHIFVWSTKTGEIVKLLEGDSIGAVNCFDSHPYFPILASSGLENDAKIWSPIGEHFPVLHPSKISASDVEVACGLQESWKRWKRVSQRNLSERRRSITQSGSSHGGISSRMMMQLLRSYLQDHDVDVGSSDHDAGSAHEGRSGGTDQQRLFRSFLLQAWASARGITIGEGDEDEEEDEPEEDSASDEEEEEDAVSEEYDAEGDDDDAEDEDLDDEDHYTGRIDLDSADDDDLSLGTCNEHHDTAAADEDEDETDEKVSFMEAASMPDDDTFHHNYVEEDDYLTTDEEISRDLPPLEDSADIAS